MPGRLAIDFGTSNTVVAVWDEARREGIPLFVPDYGVRLLPQGADGEPVPVVPSLIHYAPGNRRWMGQQVHDRDLFDADTTFRWMKRYVAHRHLLKRQVHGAAVSAFDAGRDFLTPLLAFCAAELSLGNEEIALTAPVEAFEHYEDWLAGVAEAAGMPRFHFIDEASAAALGYGAHLQPGHVYLLFDFGGGTLDVSVVLIEGPDAVLAGRRCRVLGKAGIELGGMTLDGWLYQETLRRLHRRESDDDVRPLSRALLRECERAKERLSVQERAEVRVLDPHTGAVLATEFTRRDFEELLDRHEAFTHIEGVVRRALNQARDRGYGEEQVRTVLMVGGGSLIPAVRQAVQRMFGRERVRLERPLDAVARGAAAFVAGVSFYDHIQHDYALRFVHPQTGWYDYRPLVKRGTPYPTDVALARLTVKASHDGQTHLGLAICELGEPRMHTPGALELVFDPGGAARVVPVSADDTERRTHFWINEKSPTFLVADPPARQGEARFEVEFGIDGNKRLLITARDLRTGRLTHRDFPVVKLT
jgi:molecular chaperone DnaK (HSP70)